VPIGRPVANVQTYILDRRLEPVPIGVAGELFIGGAGVARGYLHQPRLTAERFLPDPFSAEPGMRLYRTGDRARWRSDGQIEFLGRVDQQVKVRGYRIELEEIEAALTRYPDILSAAAAVQEQPSGDQRLVGYIVPGDGTAPDAAEVRRWLRTVLPEYMLPSAFVTLPSLPLSPNGKVDRKALPPIAALGTAGPEPGHYAAPGNAIEETLAGIAAGVLNLSRVGVRDNLFDLGIDSIKAIQIAARARSAGLRIDPSRLFRHPTIAELAADAVPIDSGEEPGTTSYVPAVLADSAVEDSYPLSPVQEGMLFHSMIAPESGVYVQQFTCRIHGALDISALTAALEQVIARHPVLRTAIDWTASDRPVQTVYRRVDLPWKSFDWTSVQPAEQQARIEDYLHEDQARGFDPAAAPLLRVALFRIQDTVHQLVWSNHHLLMDGWCVPVLLGEVAAIYDASLRGEPFELPPSVPFRHYITWLGRQDLRQAEIYWRDTLRGWTEPTPLGIDRPDDERHPHAPSFSNVQRSLSASVSTALAALARDNQLTLNTVIQGAWAMVLSRYSGRADVVFGVTVAGRPAELPGIEAMIGLFINTLPVRVRVPDDSRLLPWLRRLQAHNIELRRYEYSPLVRVHGWSGVPRGRPLFESLLVFENYPVDVSLLDARAGLTFDSVRILERTNYPLTLMVFPGDSLQIRAAYDSGRLDRDGIDRLLGHLETVLEGMAADPLGRLGDLPLLTAAERRQLDDWNESIARRPAAVEYLSEAELDAWIARIHSGEGGFDE
jgi:aryl carrier-like protein